MSAPIILRQVRKSFGTTHALAGLDLTVEQGQIHGFLGPNGSGKSTTLRILLGLQRSDSGEVRLFDSDPWTHAATLHRRLAYVPGDVTLWPHLTGGQIIDLLGQLRGGLDTARRDGLIERFELDPSKRARAYSKGNRQKVALIAALASPAELLLLDEPTSGLDPLMEREFTEVIREQHDQGRTVLLSSHILSEVDKLCDYVSIIKAGVCVETGELRQLRHLAMTWVSVRVPAPETTQAALAATQGVAGVHIDPTGAIRAQVEPSVLAQVLGELSRAGATELSTSPPSLEELFLSHYEGS